MSKQYFGKCTICGSNVYVYFDDQGSYAGASACKHFEGYEERDGKVFLSFRLKYDREIEATVIEQKEVSNV